MTYAVSSGTLNSCIPYHVSIDREQKNDGAGSWFVVLVLVLDRTLGNLQLNTKDEVINIR